MKIAHVVTGYGSVVTILDSKLRALGEFEDIDVTVISSPSNEDVQRKPAVKHIAVPMARTIKPLADLRSIFQLYKVLKKAKFDIVHSHTAKAGVIAAIAAKMAKVRLVVHTYHGLPFFNGQNKAVYFVYRCLEKIVCKFRGHIFTQNKRDLPACVRLIGSEDKASFEGNGVDVDFVNQSALEQLEQAAKDYQGQGLRLVLVSRLEAVKRVDDFLCVVKKLKQDGVEISAVVAGGGVLERQLRNKVDELRLKGCVNMVGLSSRACGLLAASDIVVLCSEKEGIPRAVMEAMALKKPVVATDVLGTQELVVDGETGYLVPLGDVEAMAEKIKLLGGDAALRQKMGSAGLQRVGKNFNDVKIAEFLHKFYLGAVC